MSEKPILFSGPMVRAILAGQKTQTRRAVMDHTTRAPADPHGIVRWWDRGEQDPMRWCGRDGLGSLGWVKCPYDADRLWVRETWAPTTSLDGRVGIAFRAGGPLSMLHPDHWRPVEKWKPGIHLRRVNARLTLAVESIRVERLNDISEEDAKAEGALVAAMETGLEIGQMWTGNAREAFANLWQSINGKRPGCSWYANPWVWRVAFSRATP